MPMDCTIIFVVWKVVTNGKETYVCVDFAKDFFLSADHILYCDQFLNLTPLQKFYKLLNN